MLWGVLARILAAAGGVGAQSGAARTHALLAGARGYLEAGHVTYMQNTIQANRALVRALARPLPHTASASPVTTQAAAMCSCCSGVWCHSGSRQPDGQAAEVFVRACLTELPKRLSHGARAAV